LSHRLKAIPKHFIAAKRLGEPLRIGRYSRDPIPRIPTCRPSSYSLLLAIPKASAPALRTDLLYELLFPSALLMVAAAHSV
jgi:hypothetical protein